MIFSLGKLPVGAWGLARWLHLAAYLSRLSRVCCHAVSDGSSYFSIRNQDHDLVLFLFISAVLILASLSGCTFGKLLGQPFLWSFNQSPCYGCFSSSIIAIYVAAKYHAKGVCGHNRSLCLDLYFWYITVLEHHFMQCWQEQIAKLIKCVEQTSGSDCSHVFFLYVVFPPVFGNVI